MKFLLIPHARSQVHDTEGILIPSDVDEKSHKTRFVNASAIIGQVELICLVKFSITQFHSQPP